MTKDEAIDYIREWCPYDRQDEIIKALEQEPSISEDGTLTVNVEDGSKAKLRL